MAICLDRALTSAVESPSRDGGPLNTLIGRDPLDERDALETLLQIYDLWMAPIWTTCGRESFQGHPAVADIKWRIEASFIGRLRESVSLSATDARGNGKRSPKPQPIEDAVSLIRGAAAQDLVPAVYDWLADHANWDQLVAFLALEGGPDAGFDDLVALTQVGLGGGSKVTLGANYWDEMGRGDLDQVHTELHSRLVDAIDMPRVPRSDLPVGALERMAVGGLLATNRSLQPEAIGAFGLIELQAGPRCRSVIRALNRLDAPEGAFPFYEEHAEADPHHGKAWLDHVIAPLAEEHAEWGARMVEGAKWRQEVNRRFFVEAHQIAVAMEFVEGDDWSIGHRRSTAAGVSRTG